MSSLILFSFAMDLNRWTIAGTSIDWLFSLKDPRNLSLVALNLLSPFTALTNGASKFAWPLPRNGVPRKHRPFTKHLSPFMKRPRYWDLLTCSSYWKRAIFRALELWAELIKRYYRHCRTSHTTRPPRLWQTKYISVGRCWEVWDS